MKRIAILGSTGSIGRSALSVIEHFPKEFSLVALSASSSIDLLERQIKKFRPRFAVCADSNSNLELKKRISSKTKILSCQDGIEDIAAMKDVDLVLVAISGFRAVYPLLAAIKENKQVALANKEALVAAGALVSQELKKHKATLIPVDSEQCAIFQCLANSREENLVKTIFLTASGGPFYFDKTRDFKKVTRERVLKHPRWSMGKKISVDSANLINKGLEVIEAKYLFGVDVDRIKVLIHPQAIVHSMVEFIDGSVLAQLSITDMRLPIQFALSFPRRLQSPFPRLDFVGLKSISFFKPDMQRFPGLSLAYSVAKMKPSAATVLNASNEEAVSAFLRKELNFADIVKIVEKVLSDHRAVELTALKDVEQVDFWARIRAREIIKRA